MIYLDIALMFSAPSALILMLLALVFKLEDRKGNDSIWPEGKFDLPHLLTLFPIFGPLVLVGVILAELIHEGARFKLRHKFYLDWSDYD